jgi:ketosteroid isomerase-like protein
MESNRQIVADAFAAWAAGTGYVSSIFAPDMRWEIAGRSAASTTYDTAQHLMDEVLLPFGARFSEDKPFRPTAVRAIYADDAQSTVVVVWDGEGTTTAGTLYRNTYAWVLTLRDGKVVDAIAFYDSIAFNELWANVQPASR